MEAFKIENFKIHLKHETRGNFETPMLVPLGIVVDLVKRQIGQGCSKSGIFVMRPLMITSFAVIYNLTMETQPNHCCII